MHPKSPAISRRAVFVQIMRKELNGKVTGLHTNDTNNLGCFILNVGRCLLYPGVIYCSLRCIIHCKQIRQQKQYWHFRGNEIDGISRLERGFRNFRREFVSCVSLGNAVSLGEENTRAQDMTLTNDLLLIIIGWRLY